MTIKAIIELQKANRFIVRPIYQRSEVRSLDKASKIIESLILGIKLPPIYVMTRQNEAGLPEYIVIDGQQRIISIMAFLGEQVLDENYEFIKTFKRNYELKGLKDLDYLNGEKHDSPGFISRKYDDLILDYELDLIKIEDKNIGFDPVDMFLRLNENPCTISKNSFEMWNSFEITKIINCIKMISRYELFKQKNGNSMKEEELVTVLAYMQKEKITLDNCHNFFRIHLYTENRNKANERIEVKISIMNKGAITRFLEDLVPNSDEEENFYRCLNGVKLFSDKLNILVDNDYYQLIEIFNPYIATPRRGSMKDFYLLWLILEKIDNHVLKTYKNDIMNQLSEIFKIMKNMPLDKDVDYFFEHIKSIIRKYTD